MHRASMPRLQIELLPVGEDPHAAHIEPLAVGDAKLEAKPVRQIDQILVLDRAQADVRAQAVVAAGEIRAGIVDAVRPGPRKCRASREVAVPERAQSLANPLARGIVVFVHQRPGCRRLGRDLYLSKVEHDVVCARLAKGARLSRAIDGDDHMEAARATSSDSGDCVLHHHRTRGFRPEPPGSLKEHTGRGLAPQPEACEVVAVNAHVEQRGDAGGLEHQGAIAARGHDGGTHVLRTQRAYEGDRRLVGLDAADT